MAAEDQAALQEKLKNMSPEQLAEFQKQNCIFCQIIDGKVPSKKVYEDEQCIGVLDINPAAPGHVLLLPKQHVMVMPQMPDDLIKHLFMVAKGLSHALLRALKAEGTNIFVANGGAAGQRAQHVMIHIFPRNEGDGVKVEIPEKTISEEERKVVQQQLSSLISQVLPKKAEPAKEKPEEKKKPKEAEEKKKEEGPEEEKEGEEKEESIEELFGEEEPDEEKEEEPEEKPEKKKTKKEGANLDAIADFLTKK